MSDSLFCKSSCIKVKNYLNDTYRTEINKDVLNGLTASQKFIPSKYFYDTRGSQLFEEICLLPEYYLTRTELSILKHVAPDIMGSFQDGDLVELGSGANWKIRMLLDAAGESKRPTLQYVPIDVSETALIAASEELLKIYPELKVLGIVADFTHHIDVINNNRPKLIIFFGSTIGNFDKEKSQTFLQGVADSMKPGDRFLLGLDMLKSKKILEAAYNDSQGITAEFNKNVLNVLNRELKANFNPLHFDHIAFFNKEKERVEMHLRANRKIIVEISDLELFVKIDKGETIHTEICRKFSREGTGRMVSEAGLAIKQWFTDSRGWFSLVELVLQG